MPKPIRAYLAIPTTAVYDWYSGGKPEFHTIHDLGMVETTSGQMRKAQLETCRKSKMTLFDPASDVIARVGWAKIKSSYGDRPARLSPAIWYWGGKFYMMAVDGSKTVLEYQKCNYLYQVEVSNSDDLLASLNGS